VGAGQAKNICESVNSEKQLRSVDDACGRSNVNKARVRMIETFYGITFKQIKIKLHNGENAL
jgi:hypothetical protein